MGGVERFGRLKNPLLAVQAPTAACPRRCPARSGTVTDTAFETVPGATSLLSRAPRNCTLATLMVGRMADKLDPYDIEALEKSLNDSATRVSAIWVSFLIFSLYLLIAATTVDHRQLFLAEPVKLPVLNIDLPLWGFFFLAPILFVIFHAYVLLLLLLLGRTAAAYDAAVARVAERDGLTDADTASLRQRLANTLFAQIFAGSPREREGWLGSLLRAMAWITLVFAPVLILLTFQFTFLPYHSHIATWTHRLLILLELTVFFSLWPLVLDGRRDFQWPKTWQQLSLRQVAFPLASSLLFVLASLSVATFPGEPHVNLFTGRALSSVQCERWLHQAFGRADLRVDRLVLQFVDLVDDEKLKRIQAAIDASGEQDIRGEPTQKFGERDLACGVFSDADLRQVDFSRARLQGASFRRARLQGATFVQAKLQGADLVGARLQGASLYFAWLQGADLVRAGLQGTSLVNARLQGADFDYAELQGADLDRAELQGASLNGAQLDGASFEGTQIQGASLDGALIRGVFLEGAQLQGASLTNANMVHSLLSRGQVWRTKNAACRSARVMNHKSEAIIEVRPGLRGGYEQVPATPNEIAKFIERSVADIPDAKGKKEAAARMREHLVANPANDDTAAIAKVWSDCEAENRKRDDEFPEKFDRDHAGFLRGLVCDAQNNRKNIAKGIVDNWISVRFENDLVAFQLASGLLGEDGKQCAATNDLDEQEKERLRRFLRASASGSRHSPSYVPIQE